jgi:hypothetical protein
MRVDAEALERILVHSGMDICAESAADAAHAAAVPPRVVRNPMRRSALVILDSGRALATSSVE